MGQTHTTKMRFFTKGLCLAAASVHLALAASDPDPNAAGLTNPRPRHTGSQCMPSSQVGSGFRPDMTRLLAPQVSSGGIHSESQKNPLTNEKVEASMTEFQIREKHDNEDWPADWIRENWEKNEQRRHDRYLVTMSGYCLQADCSICSSRRKLRIIYGNQI